MKFRASVLTLMLVTCPIIAHADICTDFDDDMNIIEYDCSRSFADVKREMAEKKARAVAEEQAKQQAIIAAENARKAAEEAAKAKAPADAKARQEAEKEARAKAAAEEKAARAKADAEERAAKAWADAQERAAKAEEKARKAAEQAEEKSRQTAKRAEERAAVAAERTRKRAARIADGRQYFVSGGIANIELGESISATGLGAEIGMRLTSKETNWHYMFSMLGHIASDSWIQTATGNAGGTGGNFSTKLGTYDISLQSLYLTAGVGYNVWHTLNVYGRVAPGFVNLKFGDDSIKSFDVGVILGLDAQLCKWLGVYGEGQVSFNHPMINTEQKREEFIYEYGAAAMTYDPKLVFDVTLMFRVGLKVLF